MKFEEPRRARRRRITATVAKRRHCDYIRIMLNGDPKGSRCAETSPFFWVKTSIGSCDCRKHTRGAPRRDKGMCNVGARSRVYRSRADARELNRLILRGAEADSDEVALLTGHVVNNL